METSILLYIKRRLGVSPDDDSFDSDIVMLINSALEILRDFGIGPSEPYAIVDTEGTWDDFLSESELKYPGSSEMAKTYVYLKTRLAFDPPSSASIKESFEKYVAELEWRITARHDCPNV